MNISIQDIETCRRLGLSWSCIQKRMGFESRQKMRSWIKRTGFIDPLQTPSNEELNIAISEFCNNYRNGRGEIAVKGYLLSLGYNVTRQRMRDAITSVDQEGRSHRMKRKIPRFNYNAYGPGYLWHFDTNHKLGKFGFVIFGCIDGYSHEIIALAAISNKRASTLLHALTNSEGFAAHGLPVHGRCDNGMENVAIVKFLIYMHGNVITGSSVHNQRIERLWGEVYRSATEPYKNRFIHFQRQWGLDVKNEEHIWLLQYLFIDVINTDLSVFVSSHNLHPMAAYGGRSPLAEVFLAERNYYHPLDEDWQNRFDVIMNSLDAQYEGAGELNKSKCPFVNEEELNDFILGVQIIEKSDSEDMIENKVKVAIVLLNTIVSLRI